MMSSCPSIREALFERGIARARDLLGHGESVSRRLSRLRVAFFVASASTILGLYQAAWFHAGNALTGFALLIFLLIAHYHNRLEGRLARLRIWIELKVDQVARLRLDWSQMTPRVFAHPQHHPYAADLDITGPHSLLALLDLTVSSEGQKRLKEWLLNQNEVKKPDEAWSTRQALIKELTPLALLRDRIIVAARIISADTFETTRITALVEASQTFPQAFWIFVLSLALCGTTWGLLLVSVGMGMPNYWLFSFGVYALVYFRTSGQLKPLFAYVLDLRDELAKLHAVTSILERRKKMSPGLGALCAPLVAAPDRLSSVVASLARVSHGLSIKVHPFARLLVNACVPWDWYFSVRLQQTCRRLTTVLPLWIDRLATVDAAVSLATFAYLNPDYCWPVLRQGTHDDSSPQITATNLGHPLIPPSRRVGNDFDLRGLGQILLVTGSNMSGKSTFLRTVGINVCLAQAGAPVCARSFEWSWVRVYCCIAVSDSLEDGLSYFYTEVKRLKVLLDAMQDRAGPPVLFLIDEIFKGTNNRERLLGSRAFIRALQQGYGLGLITTHDLELAQLEAESPHIANAHFQETLEADRLQFDYRLRPGICPTTNALRIMAYEGLPVPKDEQGECKRIDERINETEGSNESR